MSRLVKRAKKDIGDTILSPDSPHLVVRVEIEQGELYPDDRGFFAELFRLGATPLTESVKQSQTLQVAASVSYPGTIKAVHYHFRQTDFWTPVQGMLQVVLCDLREVSNSWKREHDLYRDPAPVAIENTARRRARLQGD